MRMTVIFTFSLVSLAQTQSPRVNSSADGIGEIIPQIANGGSLSTSFSTEFQIFSLENTAQPFILNFFDGQGNPMALPLIDGVGNSLGTLSALQGIVQAKGVLTARTVPSGPLLSGYAKLVTAGFRAIAVNTIFTQFVPGRPNFQAAIPIRSRFEDNLRVPFINTRGLTATLAWVNANLSGQVVTMIARDGSGSELCRDAKMLAGGQHDAFVVRERLPCTAGRDGLLDIATDFVGITAIAFLFNDSGAFTTQLPIEVCCLQ